MDRGKPAEEGNEEHDHSRQGKSRKSGGGGRGGNPERNTGALPDNTLSVASDEDRANLQYVVWSMSSIQGKISQGFALQRCFRQEWNRRRLSEELGNTQFTEVYSIYTQEKAAYGCTHRAVNRGLASHCGARAPPHKSNQAVFPK